MSHEDYTCKYCRYRLDNKVCSHPDSPYIGCIVSIRDWCDEFAFGGVNANAKMSIKNGKGIVSDQSVKRGIQNAI